jgi:UDP-N-acetylglucosamine--N-acetylmuramyl-(pentapeptide) pyrophosphoryl-undecaprenol N-acetylglucosamine transferase
MKKILIIAGGTGGHIFPALTIGHHLQQQGVSVSWMGAEIGMEKNLVGNQFPIYFLPVKGLRGKGLLRKLRAPFDIVKSIWLSLRHIQTIKPDVVLGMGGYASGPGGIAAKLARIPLVIHEQNALPGLTNKILSKMANTVLQAFPDTFAKSARAITVGNPIRPAIQSVVRASNHYQTRQKPWKILVLGGSQGAHFINQLVVDFFKKGAEDCVVWHQTGQKDLDAVSAASKAYAKQVHHVVPFIQDMNEAYAWADVIIARSGALTVYEVATVGLPAIFIPFPQAVDDHQYYNANFVAKNKGAVIFRESELSADQLSATLHDLFSSMEKLQAMSDAAKVCVKRDAVQVISTILGDFQ